MAKSKADWESIEADYRSGVMSFRAMEEKHGITHGAIRKRAKRDGWTRDISGKIKQKAQELVHTAEVHSKVHTEDKSKQVTEKEQIDVGAKLQADIILKHRKAIGKHQTVAQNLMTELEEDADKPKGDKTKLALSTKTGILKQLSETLKTLNGLEREAFGIDSKFDPDKGNGSIDHIDTTNLARRLIFLLTKAEREQA